MRVFRLLVLATIALSRLCAATDLPGAREILSNWTIAYCIGHASSNVAIKEEAQRTMGAYFQRGTHEDEQAYQNMRDYVRGALHKRSLASKQTGEAMPFVTCFEMASSVKFRQIIAQQDKYTVRAKDN